MQLFQRENMWLMRSLEGNMQQECLPPTWKKKSYKKNNCKLKLASLTLSYSCQTCGPFLKARKEISWKTPSCFNKTPQFFSIFCIPFIQKRHIGTEIHLRWCCVKGRLAPKMFFHSHPKLENVPTLTHVANKSLHLVLELCEEVRQLQENSWTNI